eukprot:scaffold1941_cov263-Pinguiococcus_pyrenoidosus.AAC.13
MDGRSRVEPGESDDENDDADDRPGKHHVGDADAGALWRPRHAVYHRLRDDPIGPPQLLQRPQQETHQQAADGHRHVEEGAEAALPTGQHAVHVLQQVVLVHHVVAFHRDQRHQHGERSNGGGHAQQAAGQPLQLAACEVPGAHPLVQRRRHLGGLVQAAEHHHAARDLRGDDRLAGGRQHLRPRTLLILVEVTGAGVVRVAQAVLRDEARLVREEAGAHADVLTGVHLSRDGQGAALVVARRPEQTASRRREKRDDEKIHMGHPQHQQHAEGHRSADLGVLQTR